jgi:hypothetical protein
VTTLGSIGATLAVFAFVGAGIMLAGLTRESERLWGAGTLTTTLSAIGLVICLLLAIWGVK